MSKPGDRRRPERVGIISLGCAKNLVDTEVMLGHLDRAGYEFVQDPAEADVILVNTCSFIEDAREESVQTILEAAQLKQTGKLRRLVVAGCMVQRYGEELSAEIPEVDGLLGLDDLDRIVDRVSPAATPSRPLRDSAVSASSLPLLPSGAAAREASPASVAAWGAATYLYDERAPRRLATPAWTAYVKIAEGCDHTCSFCAIPSFRGKFRSRPADSVVREVEQLGSQGVREINLIAQDSSHYGRDRGDKGGLAGLLRRLDAVDGPRWIRVHYLYPNTITDELIQAVAELPKVVEYVDLPLQHADAAVLRRMRRGGSAEDHLRLLAKFRRSMPGVTLRSTFIVGFPGETEQEFQGLLEFVEQARFDHLGVFRYSHEQGTTAHDLLDDVAEEVKSERADRIMQAQQRIVFSRNEQSLGRRVEVLVEGAHPETEHLLVGRMSSQAPEVDGQILINEGQAAPGEFVYVELTETAGYDLVGRILGPA